MIAFENILTEIRFQTSRSGGPGGQNVNKTETKVELRWNVLVSQHISESQRDTILKALRAKIDISGDLIMTSSKTRSQLANKEDVLLKFKNALLKALTPQKKRIPTKPSKGAKENRILTKKKSGVTKQLRKKIDPNDH